MTVTIDLTTALAVWGAVVSTGVLVWDVYKWRTAGPRLRLYARGGMKQMGSVYEGDKIYITAKITNFGDRPTTITLMYFEYYTSRWAMWRRKQHGPSYLIPEPSVAQPMPFKLKPGNEWIGMADQTADAETMARDGYFICCIAHSHTPKPLRMRVVLSPPSAPTEPAANE